MSFSKVLKILDFIDTESSRQEKENIISKYKEDKEFEKVVLYALDPYKKFKVTSIEYIPNQITKESDNEKIFNFLDFLNSKKAATNEDKLHLSFISSLDKETVEVVNRIISKDLKCGASSKIFGKYF